MAYCSYDFVSYLKCLLLDTNFGAKNSPLYRWRRLTTTTRIHFVLALLFKFFPGEVKNKIKKALTGTSKTKN